MKLLTSLTLVTLVFLFGGTSLAQVLCVKEKSANLRSSPSLTGSIVLLQVPKHYPLQIQKEQGDFLEVRDFQGREAWVAKSVVGQENGVIVNAGSVNLRSGPGKNNKVVFKARRGVTFQVLRDQDHWLLVDFVIRITGFSLSMKAASRAGFSRIWSGVYRARREPLIQRSCRELTRQADRLKVEFPAFFDMYSAGVRSPRESCGRFLEN